MHALLPPCRMFSLPMRAGVMWSYAAPYQMAKGIQSRILDMGVKGHRCDEQTSKAPYADMKRARQKLGTKYWTLKGNTYE